MYDPRSTTHYGVGSPWKWLNIPLVLVVSGNCFVASLALRCTWRTAEPAVLMERTAGRLHLLLCGFSHVFVFLDQLHREKEAQPTKSICISTGHVYNYHIPSTKQEAGKSPKII